MEGEPQNRRRSQRASRVRRRQELENSRLEGQEDLDLTQIINEGNQDVQEQQQIPPIIVNNNQNAVVIQNEQNNQAMDIINEGDQQVNGPQQLIQMVEEQHLNIVQNQHQEQPQQNLFQNPILNNSVVNFSAQRFLAKIPNTTVLRDFFINTGGYYVPPIRDMTNQFCRKILMGEKKLLKTKEVIWVDEVPNWKEFSSKNIWSNARNNPQILKYFPSYSISKLPQRKYLLNVVNTIDKFSVVKAVLNIRKERQDKQIEQQPIKLTNEFADLLRQFQSISSNQKRKGLHLNPSKKKQAREIEQCPLCLQIMENQNEIANFHCLRHKAHRKCISVYLKSDHSQNSNYLCPLRCTVPYDE